MIPAMVVPVLNRPELLDALLRSVDVPIGRTVVIDNGDVVTRPAERDFRVIRPGANLGVAASWNLGVKSTPLVPWWLIVNSDVAFVPGDLKAIADGMRTFSPRVVQLRNVGFSAFAVNAATFERVGLFDENLHPAYFEDNDFAYRCVAAGIEILTVSEGQTKHVGSATIFASQSYRDQNFRTFESNKAYYVAKWGGMPGNEKHQHPFGFRLSEPGITFKRLRDLAWTLDEDVP